MPSRPQSFNANRALLKTAQADARAKIQTGMAIALVQDIMAGKVEAHPQVLAVRLQAAKVLLAKTLPDLSSVELGGNEDAPISITIKKLA